MVARGSEVDHGLLERMVRAMRHRGPDDQGIEIAGTVGLAHARLSIVDLTPAGHQPLASADGRWLLTYNGEAFNHLDLRARLGEVSWRGGSDTETLAEALARWGVDAVPMVNGLFAYAALDTASRRLLLVRDRFGVKPLYVARRPEGLLFASEIRTLLSAGVPRIARPDVLLHTLERGWANGRATPVAGIERVLPGTMLEVDIDTLRCTERRWYEPASAVDADRRSELASATPREVEELVAGELRASVRRRLMSDAPLGTMCSGGIDSTLVTAMAAEMQPGIAAYNAAIVDQPHRDESPHAATVARLLGIPLHTVEQTADTWRRDLVRVVAHIEYPLTHESSVPMAQIAALARGHGVKVLLSGEGADELFGGYPFLHARERADFARRRRPHALAAAWSLRAARRRRERWLRQWRPGFGPSEEVRRYEQERMDRAREAYGARRGASAAFESGLLADLELYLPHLLNRQDKATMLNSVETRVPFLDPEMVALGLNLPLERRVEPEPKAPLRALMRRMGMPAEVVDRRKEGFGFATSPYLDGHVRPGFVDQGRLAEVLGMTAGELKQLRWQRGHQGDLALVTGEIWCRVVLDGEPVGDVEAELWRG